MYCHHCGKKINEHALEKKNSSYVIQKVDKMPSEHVRAGDTFVLPRCILRNPKGKTFKCWSVNGKHYNPYDAVEITDDTVVKALWKDADVDSQEDDMFVEVDTDARVNYLCPQCGHLAHNDLSPEELKSLSRASHSQLQRGANSFARGMALNLIGIIIGILAISFLLLSYVSKGGHKYLDPSKSTFLVFVVMAVMAVILLVVGVYSTVVGISKKTRYTKLLKDLNNKTFVQ